MLLKLRQDYKEQQGGEFSLRDVPRHPARAGHGAVLAHRQLMLGEPAATCWSRSAASDRHAAYTNTDATPAATASR